VAQRDAFGRQPVGEREDLAGSLGRRRRIEQLRADVAGDAGDVNVR
jgi:hypothetical protein